MYLKLPADYVDPDTQTPLPNAVLIIEDAAFGLRAGNAVLQTGIYASIEAYLAGHTAVSERPKALSQGEQAAQAPALLNACYQILATRPEYAGSTVVTP